MTKPKNPKPDVAPVTQVAAVVAQPEHRLADAQREKLAQEGAASAPALAGGPTMVKSEGGANIPATMGVAMAKAQQGRQEAASIEYCPKCGLTGDKVGTCGNFAIPCPPPATTEPGKQVTVKCGPCGKTITVPVEKIMQRKLGQLGGFCVQSKCAAQVIG